MSFAQDQAEFMRLGGQTVGVLNLDQAERYAKHLSEEAFELRLAHEMDDLVKAADGAIDAIYVALGYLHSIGVDPAKAFAAVHAANLRKFPGGKVYRRPDGQIGKPPGWYGPETELTALVNAAELYLPDDGC